MDPPKKSTLRKRCVKTLRDSGSMRRPPDSLKNKLELQVARQQHEHIVAETLIFAGRHKLYHEENTEKKRRNA